MIRNDKRISEILLGNRIIRRAKEAIERDYKVNIKSIEIFTLEEEEMLAMKRKYFKKEENTDIITLEYREEKFVKIEIYLNLKRIEENAKSFKKELKEEVMRVIIHAFLHIGGENDSDKKESKRMKEAEEHYLKECFT